MCGIAGVLARRPGIDLQLSLKAMLHTQSHRGPDDEGLTVVEASSFQVALGVRRLAIRDLSSRGHQPMVNPDTGDVIAYNGEIYNTAELRRELSSRGLSLRGESDTEVMLKCYELWGIACLERLRGMYAFSLWDDRKQRLLLVRDPLGIKPLYYAATKDGSFLWASEIRALLASGLVDGQPDLRAVAGYLAYGSVQEPLTIVASVKALPPATCMTISGPGESGVHTFWEWPSPGVAQPFERLVEEGKELMRTSVARHLLSDVPVGLFLSSGLDSSAVLEFARETREDLHAFTVGWDRASDEMLLASRIAERAGASHHRCELPETDVLGWTQEGLDAMDQPSLDGLNTYIVSRAVRKEGMVVALTGVGGDELFGGYDYFRRIPKWMRALGPSRVVPASARAVAARLVAARYGRTAAAKAGDIARTGGRLPSLYLAARRVLSDDDLRSMGLQHPALELDDSWQAATFGVDALVPGDVTASLVRLESSYYLRNTLLRDSDVFGMANSLEIRVPLLDLDLVEWIAGISGDSLMPASAPPKHLLRAIASKAYDPVQLQRPKTGFTLPFDRWMGRALKPLVVEDLSYLRSSGLLDARGVDQVVDRFAERPAPGEWSRVWTLVVLGHWLKLGSSGVRSAG